MISQMLRNYQESQTSLSRLKFTLIINLIWVLVLVSFKAEIIKYTLGGYAAGGGMDIDGVDIYADIAHVVFNTLLVYVLLRHVFMVTGLMLVQLGCVIYFKKRLDRLVKESNDDK